MVLGELSFVGCGTKIEFSGASDWDGDRIEFRFGDKSIWIVVTTAQAISLECELEKYLLRKAIKIDEAPERRVNSVIPF